MVGCFQSVVGNKILLVQFKDGQKKDMSSFFIQYLYLKEEVEMDNPKSNLSFKKRCGLLIIDGYPEV